MLVGDRNAGATKAAGGGRLQEDRDDLLAVRGWGPAAWGRRGGRGLADELLPSRSPASWATGDRDGATGATPRRLNPSLIARVSRLERRQASSSNARINA